ncbi:Hypothetical predicted protein [Octopus vulgaris]|uniref:Sushi domain-containing protein n=2 Tax=Octopus vulgaris TaxID=6645 RepID=A0AA36B0P0_OCTVU|nr:Hypothetical predicted protein [Octopus vulgaris]
MRRSACHSFSYNPNQTHCKLSSKIPVANYENVTITTHSPCAYRPCAADEVCVNENRSTFCFPLDIDCGYPLQYSNMVHYDVPSTKYLNEVHYFCKVGYTFTAGITIATCLLSGNWSAVHAECQPIECGTPAIIPNTSMSVDGATVNASDVPHSYLSEVTYHCLEDYVKINGSVTSTCEADSTWTPVTIQCLYVNCAHPPALLNITLSIDGVNVQPSDVPGTFNTMVTYSCSEYNVYLSGSQNSVCQLNSKWSNVTITCRYVKCGPPPELPYTEFMVNGKITNGLSVPDKFLSRVTYKCRSGFTSEGGPHISWCQMFSKWSKVFIECSDDD